MGDQQPEGWHTEDIKAALRKKHRSLAALSAKWGLNKAAVSVALNQGTRWPRVEELIARELGLAPHSLWPDRWTPEGEPRPRPSIAADHSRGRANPHRQNRQVA